MARKRRIDLETFKRLEMELEELEKKRQKLEFEKEKIMEKIWKDYGVKTEEELLQLQRDLENKIEAEEKENKRLIEEFEKDWEDLL